MSEETIAEYLLKRCNRKADCKGYGIHHPDCVRNNAENAKYERPVPYHGDPGDETSER